jgi:hypothetical protein
VKCKACGKRGCREPYCASCCQLPIPFRSGLPKPKVRKAMFLGLFVNVHRETSLLVLITNILTIFFVSLVASALVVRMRKLPEPVPLSWFQGKS